MTDSSKRRWFLRLCTGIGTGRSAVAEPSPSKTIQNSGGVGTCFYKIQTIQNNARVNTTIAARERESVGGCCSTHPQTRIRSQTSAGRFRCYRPTRRAPRFRQPPRHRTCCESSPSPCARLPARSPVYVPPLAGVRAAARRCTCRRPALSCFQSPAVCVPLTFRRPALSCFQSPAVCVPLPCRRPAAALACFQSPAVCMSLPCRWSS